jgi:hypothetical protein
VGLIGSLFTKIEERKAKKDKYEFDLKMATLRKEEAEIERSHELAMADKQIERAQAEGQVSVDISDAEAFKKSYDIPSKGIDWRGIVRPFITAYLLGFTTYLTYQISVLVGGLSGLDPKYITELYQEIITKLLFLTTTAVIWWFGARVTSSKRR